jgi:DNA-binding response OmpR family regulator
VEVALVHWPAEEDRREELRRGGQPRLLLVEKGAPPIPSDGLEDWIRLPADDEEVRVRADTLRRRSEPWPTLDADGILRAGGRWAAIPPIEARILAPMLQRPGQVVLRHDLLELAWPGGSSTTRLLDRRIMLLRGRIEPLGLVLRTVRGKGFLLERLTR